MSHELNLLSGKSKAAGEIAELLKVPFGIRRIEFRLDVDEIAELTLVCECPEETGKEMFEYIMRHYRLAEIPPEELADSTPGEKDD